jgi:hypothetical protein
LPITLPIFIELVFGTRERIKQAQLRLGREQRLVIVRPVKIDEVVAELFQDRQCRWRTVDELTRAAGNREAALDDQVIFTRLDPSLDKFWI